jgi:hypothetical protein
VVLLPLSLYRVENHVCLSRGVQVIGVAWCAAMKIMAGVGDLVQRTGDGQRSGDAMCGLHRARGDERREFLS